MTSIPSTLATLLAHEGGWDEALLIGGPVVAIAGLLMLAKKRVDAAADDARTAADPATTPSSVDADR